MKTFNTKQKETGYPVSVIQANLNKSESIEMAEKKVLELIEAGYDMYQSYGGFNSWNVILIKKDIYK
jgi:hypothetical protein